MGLWRFLGVQIARSFFFWSSWGLERMRRKYYEESRVMGPVDEVLCSCKMQPGKFCFCMRGNSMLPSFIVAKQVPVWGGSSWSRPHGRDLCDGRLGRRLSALGCIVLYALD